MEVTRLEKMVLTGHRLRRQRNILFILDKERAPKSFILRQQNHIWNIEQEWNKIQKEG